MNSSEKMIKLYISTPCYDSMVTMQYMMSILKLNKLLISRGIDYVIDFNANESLIPRARNGSLHKFMKTDFTHILFIDADIEFEAETVLDQLKEDKDVICCAYPKKGINFHQLLDSVSSSTLSNESLESRGLDYAYNVFYDVSGNIIRKNNLIKVKHASNGFMMIKREILEKLWEKHSELTIINTKEGPPLIGLFCCMIRDKQYLSEDYSFCQRVYDIGGEVWININHNLNHVGKYVFQGDIKNREYYGRYINKKSLVNKI